MQEALSAVNLLKPYITHLRSDSAFDTYSVATEALGEKLDIGRPNLPRYRRRPRRLDEGEEPHHFPSPKDYFRQQYFEAGDLMIGEITERFDQSFLEPLIAMEKTLLAAASAEDMADDLKIIEDSVFGKDFDFPRLTWQLKILPDIVKQAPPEVKKVTSIRTLCTAMATDNHRKTFSELNKLLRLYLTVPVTSATSE